MQRTLWVLCTGCPDKMDHLENSTDSSRGLFARAERTADSRADTSGGNAYLYIMIVLSFYGIFLCGIMLGYFYSKRREKKRVNIFTRLVHEEEQREWGALPKKHSLTFPTAVSGLHSVQAASLPFCGSQGNHFGHLRYESTLACALCTEQSSISSLCSSADTRIAIEEESDGCAAEGPEETRKGGLEI